MKSKFNIGTEIFYMNYDKPTKGTIKGISFVIGKFKNDEGTPENPAINYSMSEYETISENKAFATKEDLKKSLFDKL